MKVPLEHDEAVVLSQWLSFNKLSHWHIPNETFTTSWNQKRRNKEAGVTKGIPDYFIIIPKEKSKYERNIHIWIELKRQKPVLKSGKIGKSPSTISPEQLDTIEKLNLHHDTKAKICYGAEESINYIKQYLE